MKLIIVLLLLCCSAAYGQLSMDSAKVIIAKYRLGYSTYFEPFIGQRGYGAPWILTSDGGAAAFGDNMLYKFNAKGKEQWMRKVVPQFDELETQGVAQDTKGNLYVFMLSYDSKRYRGGSERVLCYDKTGKVLWDKTLGTYTLMENPIVSYIKPQNDGRIYMRGHVVKEKPIEGKDPVYRFWEGWLDSTGKLTQKAGDVIDWSKDEWQKKFKPEVVNR
jgi:outer membrane protein assembly factor BamB